MAQAARRRTTSATQSTGSVLSLLVVVALVFGGVFFAYRALTTGDLLWFSSHFDAQPRQLTIIDRGQRIEISPSDPLFAELTTALNESISHGYNFSGAGLSDVTWERVEQNGVMVEAVYPQPVKLRGGIQPTERLLLLLGGEDIWIQNALFRRNTDDWSRNPLRVSTTKPVEHVLAQHGIRIERE